MALLDGALSDRDFLLGDYSLVDTHLWAFVGWLAMMGIDGGAHAHVAAWRKRCAARPALAALGEDGAESQPYAARELRGRRENGGGTR